MTRLPRILAVACLIIALICVAATTTVFGAGWTIWVTAGLIAWAVEPLIRTTA